MKDFLLGAYSENKNRFFYFQANANLKQITQELFVHEN